MQRESIFGSRCVNSSLRDGMRITLSCPDVRRRRSSGHVCSAMTAATSATTAASLYAQTRLRFGRQRPRGLIPSSSPAHLPNKRLNALSTLLRLTGRSNTSVLLAQDDCTVREPKLPPSDPNADLRGMRPWGRPQVLLEVPEVVVLQHRLPAEALEGGSQAQVCQGGEAERSDGSGGGRVLLPLHAEEEEEQERREGHH